MELPWVETASVVTVYVYAAVIAIGITGFVVAPAVRRLFPGSRSPEPAPSSPRVPGKLHRVLVEYVGNTDVRERWSIDGPDRRRNRAARVLMNYVRGRSEASDVSTPELERVLEELRHAIRSAEQVE